MIILGGVTLSPDMQWADEHVDRPIEQSIERTLGGGLVVFSQPKVAGRSITLVASANQGWITNEMRIAILALSNVAGGVFSLTTHTGAFNVMFRHNEPPAFAAEPLLSKRVPDVGDYFTANIKLITV